MRKKSLMQIDKERIKKIYRNYPVAVLKSRTEPGINSYHSHNAKLSEKFEKYGKASYHKCYKKQKRQADARRGLKGLKREMSKQYLTESKLWNWPGWQIFKWILGFIILSAVLCVIYLTSK